jgi:hypothetical protein
MGIWKAALLLKSLVALQTTAAMRRPTEPKIKLQRERDRSAGPDAPVMKN